MPTSARWAAANLPKISEKTVHPAGAMCTGKRQTHIRNAPSSRTAVTSIDPYNAYRRCIKNSELHQASREKSRKTEGVFLVGSRGAGGNQNPPGLVFFSQSFRLFHAGDFVILRFDGSLERLVRNILRERDDGGAVVVIRDCGSNAVHSLECLFDARFAVTAHHALYV